MAIAIYLLFNIWNIDMTAWLASAGIVGIAVGFAAKDTLAKLFAGAFILADAPYKIGDYIVLDNGQRGKVTNIGLRSTRILTRDDVEVTVPNSVIGNSSVINESGGPHVKYRVRIPVGVAYGSDINLVRAALMQVAQANEQVCREPEHRVRFRSFGPSALQFELLCWIEDPELRGRAVDALNCEIYQQFIDNNIEIHYAKHDVYIKDWPQAARGSQTGTPDDPGQH
jgi:small-conductance mechanosensitive channel